MHITLRQLEIFCAIYETGTTAHASSKLNLAQSAVSSGLKQLEAQVNMALFERCGRTLVRNAAGDVFYAKAYALLQQADALEHFFMHHLPPVHVAASSTIGNYLLPAAIVAHAKSFPQQKIQLTVGNTQDIIDMVVDFSCDIGFIEGSCHHPETECHFWKQDELIWFAKRDSELLPEKGAKITISQAQFARLPIIAREAGSGTREVVSDHYPSLDIAFELGNSEAIKQAVARDLGISCLSREVLKTGAWTEIHIADEAPITRPFYWVIRRGKVLSQSIREFLTELED